MSDSLLNVKGVNHAFGPVEILRDFSLEVARGEFVALVGPSGCGKTTLLNILSGYLKPTSGLVSRAGIARMVYQHDGLFPWLTVAENISLGLRAIPDARARQRELEELLTLIDLQRFAGHYPHQISGGMRQRVELARALAGDSDVLLMDEPFSALDYQTRIRMRAELSRVLKERPRTVVFVTHDIEEAAQLADRVLVLSPRPSRIRCELRLDVPRPRPMAHPLVLETIERVLKELGLNEESAEFARDEIEPVALG